jgi:hypothetical protein
VSDEHGAVVAAERLVQRVGVGRDGARLVQAVVGDRGRRVAAQERGHHAEAGRSQLRHEVAPRVGGVGKAVEQQGQRPRAFLEVAELQSGGLDGSFGDGHARKVAGRSRVERAFHLVHRLGAGFRPQVEWVTPDDAR